MLGFLCLVVVFRTALPSFCVRSKFRVTGGGLLGCPCHCDSVIDGIPLPCTRFSLAGAPRSPPEFYAHGALGTGQQGMGTPILCVFPLLTHKGPWTSLTHTSSKVKLLHVPMWGWQQGITPACSCMDPAPVKPTPPWKLCCSSLSESLWPQPIKAHACSGDKMGAIITPIYR